MHTHAINWILMKSVLSIVLSFCVYNLQAQSSDQAGGWPGKLKGGIRIQKSQKLYWENGITLDYASPKIAGNRLHLGASYVTSRFGSALGTNAIKQDNFLLSLAYHFRHEKKLQLFTRLNVGYFHADYEYAIFDVLPNTAFPLSIDTGLSYALKIPLTISLSAGYNFNSGNGTERPGTLYPIFYQTSIYYTLFEWK